MDAGKVSARYAKALMEWAVEKKHPHEIYLQTQEMLSFINGNADLRTLLGSNTIFEMTRNRMIISFVKNFTPLLEHFVLLLIKMKRIPNLHNALLLFANMYRQRFGLIKAEVTSALELTPTIKLELESFISSCFARKAEMHYAVDPSIIGGFVLTIENRHLDKSIRGELNSIKKQLLAHN